jgi:hypothetical protein
VCAVAVYFAVIVFNRPLVLASVQPTHAYVVILVSCMNSHSLAKDKRHVVCRKPLGTSYLQYPVRTLITPWLT